MIKRARHMPEAPLRRDRYELVREGRVVFVSYPASEGQLAQLRARAARLEAEVRVRRGGAQSQSTTSE